MHAHPDRIRPARVRRSGFLTALAGLGIAISTVLLTGMTALTPQAAAATTTSTPPTGTTVATTTSATTTTTVTHPLPTTAARANVATSRATTTQSPARHRPAVAAPRATSTADPGCGCNPLMPTTPPPPPPTGCGCNPTPVVTTTVVHPTTTPVRPHVTTRQAPPTTVKPAVLVYRRIQTPPAQLAFTGPSPLITPLLALGSLLVCLGTLLVTTSRPRSARRR